VTALTLVLGDITQQPVDVIVNAANSGLLGGGGVDGAIHQAAGPRLLDACHDLRATSHPDGLPTGEAVATGAFELPATWVIHVVGPVWSAGDAAARRPLLASCYTNALALADELGAATIAFPAVSAGVYGWPADDAAITAVAAVRGASTSVEEVRFVLFGQRVYDAFAAAL
jgi:O-acetyl-ADP-ribose deacetylase (regulator of RNase III)